MAMSGLLSIYNLKNVAFLIVSANDIFATIPTIMKFEVKTKYPLPSMLIRVKINDGETLLTHVEDKKIFNLTVTFPKRGKISIDKIIISSFFPFLFFNRILKLPVNYEITVFPKPIKCDFSMYMSTGNSQRESKRTIGKSYEGEIVGIKNYNPYEPLKYIHWKASAKTSELMTKEFSPYKGNPVIVRLSDFSGDVEQKIGKATFTLIELSKKGIPVGLELENKLYKPDTGKVHLRKMLNALALY